MEQLTSLKLKLAEKRAELEQLLNSIKLGGNLKNIEAVNSYLGDLVNDFLPMSDCQHCDGCRDIKSKGDLFPDNFNLDFCRSCRTANTREAA